MNIWLAVILSPISFLIVYDVVFSYMPLVRGDGALPLGIVLYMVLMDLVMMFVLLGLYWFSKKRIRHGYRPSRVDNNMEINTLGYMFLLVSALSLFFFLVFNVFGNFDVTNVYKNNQTFYSQSKVGTSWVFFVLYAFVFVALYDIYLSGFSKFKTISVLGLILICAATGARGNVITYLFLFIIIYGVIWQGKKVIRMGAVILVLIASTFSYNTLYRSGADDLSEYLESTSSTADLNQVYAISDAVDFWYKNGACYTCFFEDLSNLFIPRYFYPDKPISNAETRLVYPDVAAKGSSYTFGIYGSSLINLGVFSFLLIPIFYFFYSYGYFFALYANKKTYFNFFLIYCGVNAVQFVRGGFFDVRLVRLFITFLLVYLFYIFVLALFGKRAPDRMFTH